MISKSEDVPMMTPAEAQRVFLASNNEADIRRCAQVIRERALRDTRTDDDNSSWVRLFLEYTIGKPRQQGLKMPALDLGDLTTLEGVQEAMQRIAEAQGTGLMTDEQVESYRKTVDRALATLRLAQGDAVDEDASKASALVWFAGADRTPEQMGSDLTDAMRAREAANN